LLSLKWLTWITTYTLIVLCELGDKTQVAVLLLASNNPAKRWLIMAASTLALTLCVAIEVTIGSCLARFIGPSVINRATGVVFLIIGAVILADYLGLLRKVRLKKAAARSQDLSI